MSSEVIKSIMITAELTGTEISPEAARVFYQRLSSHPEALVLKALERCQDELTGKLTIPAVISRIPYVPIFDGATLPRPPIDYDKGLRHIGELIKIVKE